MSPERLVQMGPGADDEKVPEMPTDEDIAKREEEMRREKAERPTESYQSSIVSPGLEEGPAKE